jgi:para-nitrobenzyl esterase
LLAGSDAVDSAVETGSNSKPPLFRPVVDGWAIPRRFSEAYAAGKQNSVLILAGNNHDETGAVPDAAIAALRANPTQVRGGMPSVNVTLAAYQAWAWRKFGTMAAEFLRLYPATNDDEAAQMNNQAARDNSRASTFLWAAQWRKHSALPVYTYFWTRGHAGPQRETRGAFHGSEISYVFNSLHKSDLPWTEQDRRAAETMSSYWANYIATGNPNGQGLPVWLAWDGAKPQVMELGTAFAPIPVASPDRLDFWRRFFASQEQW